MTHIFKNLFFFLYLAFFQKSLGDFIHMPITQNCWNILFVQVLLQINFGYFFYPSNKDQWVIAG